MPIDPRELPIYEALCALGIEYERFEHKPTVTMEICDEVDRITGVEHWQKPVFDKQAEIQFLSGNDGR